MNRFRCSKCLNENINLTNKKGTLQAVPLPHRWPKMKLKKIGLPKIKSIQEDR